MYENDGAGYADAIVDYHRCYCTAYGDDCEEGYTDCMDEFDPVSSACDQE